MSTRYNQVYVLHDSLLGDDIVTAPTPAQINKKINDLSHDDLAYTLFLSTGLINLLQLTGVTPILSHDWIAPLEPTLRPTMDYLERTQDITHCFKRHMSVARHHIMGDAGKILIITNPSLFDDITYTSHLLNFLEGNDLTRVLPFYLDLKAKHINNLTPLQKTNPTKTEV